MGYKTVIILKWYNGEIEVFKTLRSLCAKYGKDKIGISKYSLDRIDLFTGYKNHLIEIIKIQPQ